MRLQIPSLYVNWCIVQVNFGQANNDAAQKPQTGDSWLEQRRKPTTLQYFNLQFLDGYNFAINQLIGNISSP